METTLEIIENEIINQLNIANEKLTLQEFESLAESIIDYIDQIAKNKK